MRRLRYHGLAIFFGVILLLALAGLAIAGHAAYNDDQIAHARLLKEAPETISLGRYVLSSDFWNAVMENWQSEYLQFFLYLFATIWFVQRGSPESKEPGMAGRQSEADQLLGEHAPGEAPGPAKRRGGLLRGLYSNSLGFVMLAIFLSSWAAQSVTGWNVYNADQVDHRLPGISWVGYLGTGTSGRRPSRTGSRSSSPWAPSPSSPSTCASAARRSPSRWARPTPTRARRASRGTPGRTPRGRGRAEASPYRRSSNQTRVSSSASTPHASASCVTRKRP